MTERDELLVDIQQTADAMTGISGEPVLAGSPPAGG